MNVLQTRHTHMTGDGESWPVLLTVDEAAALLRTTRRAMYAMVERRQNPALSASVVASSSGPRRC
jgi:hypothetical protein